ncbi:hypothetical protein SAMN05444157_0271 [Frankineae bacterium MT45]|nr:hypothetical protein SAMN05444157_0271 [Frankineae bacterium MT45]
MFSKKIASTVAVLAAAGAISLTACSSSGTSATSTSAAPSSALSTAPVATIPNLTGVSTAVALDKGFTDALTTLKLTPGTVGTASLADGSISFPITGGNVTYYTPGSVKPYVQGDIQHMGSGLSLTAGTGATATVVKLTNFDIDPGNNSTLYGDVAVNDKTAATHTKLFDLDGTTLKPLQTSGNTAILEGTRVLMSDNAAALLNTTFNTTAVKGGLLIGIAKITVNTK